MSGSKSLEEANLRAQANGVIKAKSAVEISEVQALIESDTAHPHPMINYLIEEVRKLTKQLAQQKATLADGVAQIENLKRAITATQGAIQKTTFDIAQLHAFAGDGGEQKTAS